MALPPKSKGLFMTEGEAGSVNDTWGVPYKISTLYGFGGGTLLIRF